LEIKEKKRKKRQLTLIPITDEMKELREKNFLKFLKEFQKKGLAEYRRRKNETMAKRNDEKSRREI